MDLNNNSAAPQSGAAMLPEPKKRNFLWLKVLAGVLILVFLGAGVALAFRVWDPLWNPFRPSPEKVLQKMFENIKSISGAHTEADVRISGAGNVANSSFVLKLKDDTNKSNAQGKIILQAIMQGIQLSGEGSYVILGNDLFFKIDSLPSMSFLPIDLSQFTGKWYKITGLKSSSNNLTNLLENQKDIIYVKKQLPDEKINGISVYHYVLGLQQNGIKDLLGEALKDNKSVSQEQINQMAQSISGLDIEYWIGKKDNYPYKIGRAHV